uniref:Ubiquitin-like domain-containing protein n=1 Tax=Caenorhabditis tropicalis TaxID=1561998 RepID=A0A1I7TWV8_9PELO
MSEPAPPQPPPDASSNEGPASRPVRITVKTLDDREISLTVMSNQTVQDLIELARLTLNIQTGSQRIIFGGRVLNSALTIEVAGITDGQTVHIVDRGPTTTNDRPNVVGFGARGFQAPFPPGTNPNTLFQRFMSAGLDIPPAAAAVAQPPPVSYTLIPPIRVPAAIGPVPVLNSTINPEVVHQKTLPCRTRPLQTQFLQIQNPTSAFLLDPNYIQWTIRIVDSAMFQPRSRIEQMIRNLLQELDFIPDDYKQMCTMMWDTPKHQLAIAIPELPPHIPSPALEKLDFLALWTEQLTRFNNKFAEPDGLCDAIQQILQMVQERKTSLNLTEQEINQRFNALDAIIRDLEAIWADVSHQKDYERDRFRKHNTAEYRRLKIEEYARSSRNPRFYMRHALDIDLIEVIRAFRHQRLRFAALEDLLDDLNEVGALKFIRDSMRATIDYRYRAVSMFFTYMQRMRHQIAHMTHLCADLDVPFMTPGTPQRLLPNYATNVLQIPYPHGATILIKFEKPRADDSWSEVNVRQIMEPPRVLSDPEGHSNGTYPYLPYNPPSVHMEAIQQPPRRIADPRGIRAQFAPPGFLAPPAPILHPQPPQAPHFVLTHEMVQGGQLNIMAATDPSTGMSLQDMIQMQQDHVEALINNAQEGAARVRATAAAASSNAARPAPRRYVTTVGDTPSVPVETQPPPRHTNYRFNVQPDARGPDTETLAPLPVQIEPSELQRIARNISSRYRAEALQRIATNLTTRFNDESWDTRIQNMPLCTLRECVAIALELLTSSGNSVNESRDLMLALVRDEEVLVRAIAECVKSLFGRGEFPTHVARLIMPRNETASARNDYESVDHVEDAQSDEYDGMIVRVPSDISQPQSGDLRAIRERRMSRRQFLENRGRVASAQPSTSSSSAPAPGPSFNSEDQAEIRAGRLPLGNRPARRTVRETVHPAPAAARAESPSHISLTFTSTFPAYVPINMAGPSTSQVVPPWEAPIMPIRQVVSPTPTTRALHDFDISDVSDQMNAPTPSPPAPTPRSAPATVTSSPTREMMETDDPNELARHAARLARARIDHLAATFNGNLADSRRQSPFTGTQEDQRRAAPNRFNKPMVAIDPFMHCTNRHCEINRLTNPTQLADMERYTLQSIRPDEEFVNYVQHLLPVTDRRPHKIPSTDKDYNYMVRKHGQGELSFQNTDVFKKFIKTSIRSLLATCVDADTLYTMNMNPISGYPAANHTELMKMVKDHINGRNAAVPSGPAGLYRSPGPDGSAPAGFVLHPDQHRERIEAWNRSARAGMDQVANHAAALREQIDRGAAAAVNVFPAFPIDMEQEVLIPGQMASLLTNLVDYMENPGNPRPPGVFSFLLDLTYDRLTRHDFAQLARRSTAVNVVAEYEGMIRRLIRREHLQGRSTLTNAELQEAAERIANTTEFFDQFMEQNDHMPTEMEIEGQIFRVSWIFRQIEISFIKSLLTLALLDYNSATMIFNIMRSADNYLTRNLFVFWRMNNGIGNQVRQQLYRISQFFARIRFGTVTLTRATAPITAQTFIENWNRVMDYWFDRYQGLQEDDVVRYLLNVHTGEWNDAIPQNANASFSFPISTSAPSTSNGIPPSQPTPSSSEGLPSSSSSSGAVPTSSNNTTVATTNNNPRKRNHDGNDISDSDDVGVALMTSLSTSSPSAAPSTSRTPSDSPSDQ